MTQLSRMARLLEAAGQNRARVRDLLVKCDAIHERTGAGHVMVGDLDVRLGVIYRDGKPVEYLLHNPPALAAA